MNKKKDWKFSYHLLVSVVITFIGSLSDLVISGGSLPYLMNFLNQHGSYKSSHLSMIGGADGPTAIFLSGNPWLYFLGSKLAFLLILLALYLPTRKFLNKKLGLS